MGDDTVENAPVKEKNKAGKQVGVTRRVKKLTKRREKMAKNSRKKNRR